MIVPSKFTPFEDSILFKMLIILENRVGAIGIEELYAEVEHRFLNIDEYIYSIDVLYTLGYVNVDIDKGVIEYVNRNKM